MAAAPTRTGASQGGASSPSSRVRAACQAMSPAPAAASRRFRILPSRAAASTGKTANSGASSAGQSGGGCTAGGAPGGGGGGGPLPPPGAAGAPAEWAASRKTPDQRRVGARPPTARAPPGPNGAG